MVVGSVFSYARNAPMPTSTTRSTMPAASHPRRPIVRRRRSGRLSGRAVGDGGSRVCKDVDIDNGPPELCHQVPQERGHVEAGGVAALERDLQRVLADEGDVPDAELCVAEALHA